MKRLLLATVLLSTAMSDDLLTKEDQRVSARVHERQQQQQQIWPRRESWLSRDNLLPSGNDDFPPYATRVTPVLGPTIVAKSGKFPPLTFLRSTTNRRTQYGSPNLANCKVANPPLLVTLDFRRFLGKDDQFVSGCSAEKCRRRTESWEVQTPFYVDEPRWIEIESDYPDTISDRFVSQDPFVLSRGKKLDNTETREKTALDYEEADDRYDGINANDQLRRRRSARSWKHQEKRLDRTEKMLEKKEDDQRTTGRRNDPNYSGVFENIQDYKDPFFLTRGKKRIIPDRRYQRLLDDRLDEIDAKKLAIITKLMRGKRSVTSNGENRTNETNTQKKKENQETAMTSEETEPTTHSTSEDSGTPNSEDDDSPTQFEEADWKPNEGFNFIGEKEFFPNSRGKRSNYDGQTSVDSAIDRRDLTDQKILDGYNQWIKDFQGSDRASYVDRRDKHADLKDILEQPFFISRGKKAASLSEEIRLRQERNEEAYRQLIRELTLKSMINRIINGKIVKKQAPRDRRGQLDDLLAKYDPFFLARGKRLSMIDSSLEASRKGDSNLNSYSPTN